VVHPEKGPRVKEFIEKFKKVIESKEGTIAQVDEWGARDLAYRIEKQGEAFMPCCATIPTAQASRSLSVI